MNQDKYYFMIDTSTNILMIYHYDISNYEIICFFYKIYLNLFIKLICYLNLIIETICEEAINFLVRLLQFSLTYHAVI